MNKKELHGHMIAFHVLRMNSGLENVQDAWITAMEFYCLGAGINFIITANAYAKWIKD